MEMTAVKLKYLFILLQNEEQEYTVSSLARVLGVAKSTVSRTLDSFEQQGITRAETLQLTEYGKRIGKQYLEERNLIALWLMSELHSSYEVAKDDAVHFLLSVTQETKEILLAKARYAVMCDRMKTIGHLDGTVVARCLGDGTYQLPFTFYRERSGKHDFISMANRAFHHPAALVVKNGAGMIYLRAKMIEETSMLGGFKLKGKLESLKYLSNNKYLKAGQDQDQFFLPLDALDFHFERKEKMLQASIKLKMACSVGVIHMPESVAILTIFIQP